MKLGAPIVNFDFRESSFQVPTKGSTADDKSGTRLQRRANLNAFIVSSGVRTPDSTIEDVNCNQIGRLFVAAELEGPSALRALLPPVSMVFGNPLGGNW